MRRAGRGWSKRTARGIATALSVWESEASTRRDGDRARSDAAANSPFLQFGRKSGIRADGAEKMCRRVRLREPRQLRLGLLELDVQFRLF